MVRLLGVSFIILAPVIHIYLLNYTTIHTESTLIIAKFKFTLSLLLVTVCKILTFTFSEPMQLFITIIWMRPILVLEVSSLLFLHRTTCI